LSVTIEIPTFDFSAFYYAEILESLVQFKRTNVPELTDESEFEPSMQLLRAYALVGHLNNTLIDVAANENTLPTAKLPETVRNQLRLIGYELRSATPAQTDIAYELSKVFTTSVEVVSERAQAATKRDGGVAPVYFEALEALTVNPTNVHDYVYAEEASAFTDYTAKANSQTTPGDDWTPWAAPAIKDSIYWGHITAMWDKLSVFITTLSGNLAGVWEYYDGDWEKTAPTAVADLGGSLEVDLTSLLGTSNRQGTIVRVRLNETTAFEEVESTWTGTVNIATTGLLGQSSPSVTAADYTVGSDWSELGATDGSANLTASGEVDYELPQTIEKNWIRGIINGSTAYWIRFRITEANAPTAPVMTYTRMDEGKQYVLRSVTQGESYDEAAQSSTGLAGQRFETSQDNFIWGSEELTIEGDLWTRVDSFLNSTSVDKHYVVELGENDRATWVFGGTNNKGMPPPVGVGNIVAAYRYGAHVDGNVGYDTITVDKTGLVYTSRLWNPRQATGWQEAQSASEESLEQAKIEGPADFRIKTVALGPDDVVQLTKSFVDDDGASPFSRAAAIEEGYGPKTVEAVVVAAGGGLASTTQLGTLEEYFNGDRTAVPPKEKHIVANQEVVAVNYTQKIIDITATVYGDVESEEVVNQIRQLIQPEALKADGVTYEWEFGAEVPLSRINSVIFDTDPSITKVVLTVPASDTALQSRELPLAGTVNITVIAP
jgi:hypothetical protein